MADRPLELFPVAIGAYEHHPDLDVDAEVRRVAELLADFGAVPREWAAPAAGRGGDAVDRRLASWSADPAGDTVLYWVGHGWSNDQRSALAHAFSNPTVANGVSPEDLAEAFAAREGAAEDDWWAVVVIDACRSDAFAKQLSAAIDRLPTPARVLLVGVSDAGSTTLGAFADRLGQVLGNVFGANAEIPLWDLARELKRLLPPGAVVVPKNIENAALVRRVPAVSGAPLDVLAELSAVLADLTDDERQHFLPKAQGADLGDIGWYFQGREAELERIASWLRTAESGLLVVTGRAGAGKSALLGQVVAHSRPRLREALVRHGLTEPRPPEQLPPDDCFDLVVNCTGLHTWDLLDLIEESLNGETDPFTVLLDGLDEAADPLDLAGTVRELSVGAYRFVVGTRASTRERPDLPAPDDADLLDALGATEMVRVTRDPAALAAYVRARLAAAPPGTVDPDEVVRAVEEADQGFLYARLAVHEILADPAGDHRYAAYFDLFDTAVARLAGQREAFGPLLYALGIARGRGLPMRDGVWVAVAHALGGDTATDDDVAALIEAAAPYVTRDLDLGQTVYRLSHRIFAEYTDPANVFNNLLVVDQLLAEPVDNPYLLTYLSRHAAAGGPDGWVLLAARPDVLDRLNPRAVAADALRSAAGGVPLPPDVAGMAGAADRLAVAHPDERAGLRQLAAARHTPLYRPADQHGLPWRVRWAAFEQQALNVRLTADEDLTAASGFAGPDGSPVLVTGAWRGTVRLWDPLTGQALGQPREVAAGPVGAVAGFTGPDGRVWTAAGGDDGRVLIWSGDRLVHTLIGHRGAVRAITVLADGLLATGADDPAVRLWNPVAGREVAVLRGNRQGIRALAGYAGADGRPMLVSGGADGGVRVWDLTAYEQVGSPMYGHVGAVEAVAAVQRPDGPPLLAVAGGDAVIRVWDPRDGSKVGKPFGDRTVTSSFDRAPSLISWTDPSGRPLLAAGGGDGRLRVWDPVAGEPVGGEVGKHGYAIRSVVLLPVGGGRALLGTVGDRGEVRVWNPATAGGSGSAGGQHAAIAVPRTDGPARLFTLAGLLLTERNPATGDPTGPPTVVPMYRGGPFDVVAPARGPVAVYGDNPYTLRFQQLGERADPPLRADGYDQVTAACGYLDGAGDPVLAVAYNTGTIRRWMRDRRELTPLPGNPGPYAVMTSFTGPDGRARLAIGQSMLVRVLDPADGRVLAESRDHDDAVGRLTAFTDPAGRPLLISADTNGRVLVQDPETGRIVGDLLVGRTGVAPAVAGFTDPRGRTVVAAQLGGSAIRLVALPDELVAEVDTGLRIRGLVAVDDTGIAVVTDVGVAVLDFSGVLADPSPRDG